jgi:hypothetical protein
MDPILTGAAELREHAARVAGGRVPNEVVLPTHEINMKLISIMRKNGMLAKDPSTCVDIANRFSWTTGGWVAYRESKRIYKFTPELARELDKLRQPLSFPIESLTIPSRCVVLDFSAYMGENHESAYIMVSYDAVAPGNDVRPRLTWELMLNITQLTPRGPGRVLTEVRLTNLPVKTSGQSIYGAFRDHMIEARDDMLKAIVSLKTNDNPHDQVHRDKLLDLWEKELGYYDEDINGGPAVMVKKLPILPLVINALFYIRGDKDVVREIHPGAPPLIAPRKKTNARKAAQRLDIQDERVKVLGERFTQALKHYELEKERLKDEAHDKGTKAPHLRKPHLHTYRTGEGRTGFALKFLGWVGVAGAEVPAEMNEMFATITPVE